VQSDLIAESKRAAYLAAAACRPVIDPTKPIEPAEDSP
jgi:hypothetical protein